MMLPEWRMALAMGKFNRELDGDAEANDRYKDLGGIRHRRVIQIQKECKYIKARVKEKCQFDIHEDKQ